jgi:hypothetical protein
MKSVICLFLLLLFVISINPINEKYLYPVKDEHCEIQNLKKAYGPTMCILKDGTFNLHTNCRCVDPNTGDCEECYPTVNKPFATLIDDRF